MDVDVETMRALPYEPKCFVLDALWQVSYTIGSLLNVSDAYAREWADHVVEVWAAALDG